MKTKKVAVGIDTSIWLSIIRTLRSEGWKVSEKYIAHDAGIDFDFLILKKGNKSVMFGWDNWSEGEIKTTLITFDWLKAKFNYEFKFGKPVNLKFKVILLTRTITFPQSLIRNPDRT